MSTRPDFGNDFSHLLEQASNSPEAAFSGAWSYVEFQPDAFVPQSYTIGVVVQPMQDRLYFKLLEDFKKFDCLYEGSLSQRDLRDLMFHAEETLRISSQNKAAIPEVRFDTASLRLSAPQYTSGDNIETTVERLFSEVVVMAWSQKKQKSDFVSIDTPHARSLVNEELKRIASLDYDRIVRQGDNGVLLEEDGIKHYLDLNLVTGKACGSVTSVVYKSPQTVELNVLKSSRDLTTFSRVRKMDNIGLFLLMPDETSMGAKEFSKIGEIIDQYGWKLEQDGFRVVSMPSPADLAAEIYNWAKPTFA